MITYLIIGITALVSILAFNNRSLFDKLLFDPYRINHLRQYHRFFTHGIVHADWMHLLINMFVLLSFGSMVEQYFAYHFGVGKGLYFFILLYVGALFISAAPSYGKHRNDTWYTAVGASGAVSAVVFASILMSPLSGIRFVFIPFDIPAFIFGILYLAYSAFMAKRATDNIGHDAHFYGALFGLLFTIIIKPVFLTGFINEINNYIFG